MESSDRKLKETCLNSIQEDTEWVESTLLNNAETDTADYQAQLITIRLCNHFAKRLLSIVKDSGDSLTADIDLAKLKELSALLTEYKEILNSYLKRGKGVMSRVFKSSKLRKRLDQVNAELHTKLGEFVEALKQAKAKARKTEGGRGGVSGIPTESAGSSRHDGVINEKVEATSSISEHQSPTSPGCVEDAKTGSPSYISSSSSWVDMFQMEIMVPWETFISKLKGIDTTVSDMVDPAMESCLKDALDTNNTGSIPVFRWEDFVKAFAPLPLASVLRKAKSTLLAPWFHGHLTAPDAEQLLCGRSPGTFLVRFSLSVSGSFAIAFVAEEGVISHTLVVPKEEGLYVQAESTTGPFESLQAIISHYKDILQVPFESSLTTQKWFYGDVSSSEAALLLAGQSPGTFLMRFSSIPGCLAVTYVTTDGKDVRHSLIEPTPDRTGYVVQGTDTPYSTLQDLITDNVVFGEPLG